MLKYRQDIDGLRALAIIPVVLYHLGYGVFSGGFVGVDVFFVISGFLITSIIWKDISKGEFTFGNFWKRRAIRILPAMYLVIVAVLIYGWFYSAPTDYESIGRAVRQQVFFASNIFFYESVDYFSEGLAYQPLLHMWSLAVEEQFYIAFPLICILAYKVSKGRSPLGLFLLLLLLSLSGSIYVIADDPLRAFYFTHLRAWELLAGSCLAVFLSSHKASPGVLKAEVLGVIGLLLVVAPVFILDHDTVFPGWSAIPSVLGAVLLIYSGAVENTFIRKLLSAKVLVFVGLISYSLYLWHWPIYAYFTYVYGALNESERFLLLIASLLVSYLSYRLVEQPVRRSGSNVSGKKVAAVCIFFAVVLAVVGQFIRKEHGYIDRLPEAAKVYANDREWGKFQKKCSELTAERLRNSDYCRFGPKSDQSEKIIVTWGDSHNAALLPLYKAMAEKHQVHVKHFGKTACNLMVDDLVPDAGCKLFNDEVFTYLKNNDVTDVIVASRWSSGLKEESYKPDKKSYDKLTESGYELEFQRIVKQFSGLDATVWLVTEVPLQKYDVAEFMTKSVMKGDDSIPELLTLAEHRLRVGFTDRLLINAARDNDSIKIINTESGLCDDHECKAIVDGRSLYKDDDHLSNFGAMYLESIFSAAFGDGQF